MKQEKVRILLVEDEEAIVAGLADLFIYHGYAVEIARDGNTGLTRALSKEFGAIILDVMLPGIDGFSVLERIRSVDRSQPIIMLTAKGTEDDVITGLRLGADDYIGKPFSVRELVLRVEAVLRRAAGAKNESGILTLGDLKIDTRDLTGTFPDGNTVEFTRREVDILLCLHERESKLVRRGELLSLVWGYERAEHIETRTVDIHIAKLRRKIERNPASPTFLVTVRGEGYRLLRSQWNRA